MLNMDEKINYWTKFFYDKKQYLERSLKEVSNVEVETLASTLTTDTKWKKQWEALLDEPMQNEFPDPKPLFYGFAERFFVQAIQAMNRKGFIQNKEFHSNSDILTSLLPALFEKIMGYSYKTLIVELNAQREHGILNGESSEERYQDFERLLYDSEYLRQLANTYPVLIRSLLRMTGKWTSHVGEVLNRFENDRPQLLSHMPKMASFGKLVRVHNGAGDTHAGRSVTVLEFACGNRIVYKPRSLQVDNRYNEILDWMFKHGIAPMKTVVSLDCGNYGWTEFIRSEACENETEIHAFYHRMGVHLAMMYIFNATDFHYENIIAHGSSPVLIDLESLFHQTITRRTFENNANGHAYKILANSVMSSGMLPQYVHKTEAYEGMDVSGIFGYGGKTLPNVMSVVNGGTDQMRLEKGCRATDKTYNLPQYNGEIIDSYRYTRDIEQGFIQAYRIMMEHKSELEARIRHFEHVRVRVIVRNTRTYGELMRTLYHPDLLRDELDRKVVLHRLWLQSLADPKQLNLVAYEMQDIENGDIPMFTTSPAETDVWSSNNEKIPRLLETSGMEVVKGKIRKMDEKDLAEQLQLLHLSILASRPNLYAYTVPEIRFHAPHSLKAGWKSEFIRMADSIGAALMNTSIASSDSAFDDATWIGLVGGHDERQLRLIPVGNDLYNGNSGIALFFGYLAEFTINQEYKKMARKTLQPIIEILRNNPQAPAKELSIAAFDIGSIGGGIFAAYQLSRLWSDDDLLEIIKGYLPRYCRLIDGNTGFDYISGTAGAIDILLNIYHGTGWNEALLGARTCAEHLMHHARKTRSGSLAWESPSNKVPYVGYSHGVAGIIAPLSSLYRVTKDEIYKEYITKGLQYERENYHEELKNWVTPGDTARVTWCHGAPGILLSRLRLLQNGYSDSALQEEIKVALETTVQAGFGGAPVYCHGDLGQLEILLFADKVLHPADLHDSISAVRAHLLGYLKDQPWQNVGIHRAFDNKGLMSGLSGIGLGLLKQVFLDKVPDILNLENF